MNRTEADTSDTHAFQLFIYWIVVIQTPCGTIANEGCRSESYTVWCIIFNYRLCWVDWRESWYCNDDFIFHCFVAHNENKWPTICPEMAVSILSTWDPISITNAWFDLHEVPFLTRRIDFDFYTMTTVIIALNWLLCHQNVIYIEASNELSTAP